MPNLTPDLRSQLPEDLLDVANSLIVGSTKAYHVFKERFQTAQSTIELFGQDIWDGVGYPLSLQHGQTPLLAGVTCCDSRVSLREITGGAVGDSFGAKNICGGVETQDIISLALYEVSKNPITSQEQMNKFLEDFSVRVDPNRLSGEAIQHITYAFHIGVKKYLVLGHGRCGGVANAFNKKHEQELPWNATTEELTLRLMYLQKSYLREMVRKNGVDYYINQIPDAKVDNEEAKLHLAGELAHAQHTAQLADAYIRENLEPDPNNRKMPVARGFFDIRSLNVYLGALNDKPYVQLTYNEPFADLSVDNCCGHNHAIPPDPIAKDGLGKGPIDQGRRHQS